MQNRNILSSLCSNVNLSQSQLSGDLSQQEPSSRGEAHSPTRLFPRSALPIAKRNGAASDARTGHWSDRAALRGVSPSSDHQQNTIPQDPRVSLHAAATGQRARHDTLDTGYRTAASSSRASCERSRFRATSRRSHCCSSEAITITKIDKFPKGKTAVKFFSAKQLRAFVLHPLQKNIERASAYVDSLAASDKKVDLKSLFHDFKVDTFAEIGLGVEVGCIGSETVQSFQAAIDAAAVVISKRFRNPEWFWKLQSWANVGDEAVLPENLKTLRGWLRGVIHSSVKILLEKQQGSARSTDIRSVVDLFLEASHKQREGILEEDIVEFILTFVVAAHETDTL